MGENTIVFSTVFKSSNFINGAIINVDGGLRAGCNLN
jgi:hypothetical protein